MHRKMLSVQGKGYSKIYSENPFREDPPPKAFYYPTEEKSLSQEQKQLSLSPKRADGRKVQEGGCVAEKKFLSGCHAIKPLASVQTHLPRSPASSHFDESWPDSERPSSPSMASEDLRLQQSLPYASVRKHVQPTFTSHPVGLGPTSVHAGDDRRFALKDNGGSRPGVGMAEASGEKFSGVERMSILAERENGRKGKGVESGGKGETGRGSVLQRYVERFRHGTPMSREERARLEAGKTTEDFWWLDSGLPTPNSTSTPKEQEGRSLSLTGQGKGTLTVENVRKRDDLDAATRHLQEKAERVLHSAGSMTSSGPVVSTDGLGSTGSDITGSSFSEAAVRPTFFPRENGYTAYLRTERQVGKGAGGITSTPHEDILYKWRLQRKLEAARHGSFVPAAEMVKDRPLPKTSAEKDIERRLACFRDSLMERGSVMKTHILQARVEKDMKHVQSMMDTAVQTSPEKSSPPSSSSSFPLSHHHHHPTQPPPPSSNNNKGVISAAETHDKESNIPPATHHRTYGQQSHAQRPPPRHAQHPPSPDSNGEACSRDWKEKRDDGVCDVKYRQFLEAEKPQDVEGTTIHPTSVRTVDRDSSPSPSIDRITTDTDYNQPVQPGPSQRTHPEKQTAPHESDLAHPQESGDGSFTDVKTQDLPARKRQADKVKVKLADGGDAAELPERDGDSDSSSARSISERKEGRSGADRHTENKKKKKKNLKDKTEAGEGRRNDVQKSGNVSKNGDSSPRWQDDGCDLDDSRASSAHRKKPPTDAAAQSRSGGERSWQRSGVMPPPLGSSSPARTPLSSAIGQVVQDRIFDMSVSVMSSVDSMSSLQRSVVSPLPASHQKSATAESDAESDGEFESDPLLAVLRQQRQSHESQLRCLDAILAERGAL